MKHAWMLAVAACGGGASPVAHDGYGAAFARAMCERELACCGAAQTQLDFGNAEVNGEPIDSEAQCEAWMEGIYAAVDTQDLMPGLAAGRMVWSADAAGACVDAIANTACGDFQVTIFPVSCGAFWGPQVADAGACAGDLECTSGWCTGYDENGENGSCAAPPGAGEACSGTCATGLVCKDTCVPPLAGGAACDRGAQCASMKCTDDACEPERICPPEV